MIHIIRNGGNYCYTFSLLTLVIIVGFELTLRGNEVNLWRPKLISTSATQFIFLFINKSLDDLIKFPGKKSE